MARNITQLTLSSLTLALSLTGCGGRDLTLGTRDEGVNLDDEDGLSPDVDGVGETGTGTGSGGGAPSDLTISEPGFMGPAEADDSSGSGGGAAAMGAVALTGAGPCADGTSGYVMADLDSDSGVKVDGDGTTTIYRRDGSKTVILPDGTETTTQDAMIATAEDGTLTLYFSDGTVMTLLPDESVRANGETANGAVWSVESWSVEGGPSGSTGTGTAPSMNPCETMEPSTGMEQCSAGYGEIRTYTTPQGEVVSVSVEVTVGFDPAIDGPSVEYRRDGTRTTIELDGTVTIVQDAAVTTDENGTQTLRFSDGVVMTVEADGTTVTTGDEWASGGGPSCEGDPTGGGLSAVDTDPTDPGLPICFGNGDGTYSYVEADGTRVTVSRPEPLPDGPLSMEEGSLPCFPLWVAEDSGSVGAMTMDPAPEE